MIAVQDLVKSYGPHRGVEGVSFSMEKGEVLGFLGPNGAGKTTLMRVLTCYFPPTQGKATVAGYDCFEDSLEVRKRIGYLPERIPLYDEMTVTKYLGFVAGMKGVEGKQVKKQVAKVMDDCGVSNVANRIISNLSRGYRQRVGLAQALVNDPEVLILDEPTVGLDPGQIKEIRGLIKDLAGKHTVILSTHTLPEVSLLCSKVIIINEGKLVAMDTPENLTSQMQGASLTRLQIIGPADQVETALRAVDGVQSVKIEKTNHEGSCGFLVKLDEKKEPRKKLYALMAEKNWDLIEIHSIAPSLEDVFIKLVIKEE